MGVIAKDDRKITLYYSGQTSLGKQTLGYVEASKKEVLAIDISQTKVTGTQWVELADKLKLRVSDLINTDHPDFVQIYGSKKLEMEQHDWLKVLEKTPHILGYPIVLVGNVCHRIETPSDFVKFMEHDSAGLDKPYK